MEGFHDGRYRPQDLVALRDLDFDVSVIFCAFHLGAPLI